MTVELADALEFQDDGGTVDPLNSPKPAVVPKGVHVADVSRGLKVSVGR